MHKIEDMTAEFMRSRVALGCTEKTMTTYQNEIVKNFRVYLRTRLIETIEGVTVGELTECLAWYRDRGVSVNTLVSVRIRIAAFINWCGRMGYLEEGLMKSVPKPRARQYIRHTHTDEEVSKIMDTAADVRLYHPFDRQEMVALFTLVLDTGLRASEVVGLDVGDVAGETIKIRGKGDKDRFVVVSETTLKALTEYLKLRPGAHPQEPLFINRGYGRNYHLRGQRISTAGLYQRVKRLGRAAGIQTSPHMWRHTFALWSIRNGANLKALQFFLGHSSVETTDNYLRGFGFQDAAREHRTFSPVQSMKMH
jgi:site-specific recombinase XerD